MTKANQTRASQVFVGFKIQEIYALMFLVDRKYENYNKVEIETVDDIRLIGNEDTEDILCQIKSTEISNKKITNASENLWKTLYNWLYYIKEGSANINTTLWLIFDAEAKVGENDFVNKINNADTPELVEELYLYLKQWYEKNYVEKSRRSGKQPKIIDYLGDFFKEENQKEAKQVLKSFKLTQNRPDHFNEIERMIKESNKTIPDELLNGLTSNIIYWFHRQLLEKRPISIERDDYNDMIKQYVSNNFFSAKFQSADVIVAVSDKEGIKKSNPLFVQELIKIETNDADLLTAIDHFIKVRNDRGFWLLHNHIQNHQLNDFDESLEYEWNMSKQEVLLSDDDILRKSKKLRIECMKKDRKLDNRETPWYFTKGSYHHLANNKRIYWYIRELENKNE